MGDETSQAVAGFMRHDLGSAILTTRSRRCDLASVSGVGARSNSLSLLSLLALLGVCESENDLKVKQKRKSFSGSKALFYGQSYSFSRKLYFTCAPKHAAGCKIFSGNHLHPKQMHPKLQTRFLRDTTFQLVTNKEDRNIRIFQYSPAEHKTNT